MSKTILYRKGFTLLETLTSIGIIALVIIGPLAAIINSSSYARKTKDTMTATYLAEGNIELLQNQYDSLYVYCRKKPDDAMCTPLVTMPNETSSQVAWRLFKERFTATSSQPSCYLADNPDGCAFDSLNMIGNATTVPVRYVASSPLCSSMVDVAIPVVIDAIVSGNANGTSPQVTKTITRHSYRCSGVSSHIPVNATSSAKSFKRSITLERIANPAEAITNSNPAEQYNDDIRIVSKVEFKTFRGSTSSISVTRFMHARQ
jgi:type II secretory pathway pseudopilin PulG